MFSRHELSTIWKVPVALGKEERKRGDANESNGLNGGKQGMYECVILPTKIQLLWTHVEQASPV